MLEQNIKSLIVVLPTLFFGFFLARQAFSETIDAARIDRWRNLFIVVTIAGFLVPNFWLMLVVVAVLILILGGKEPIKPALFLLLLCVLPPTPMIVPGFAGINNFLSVSPKLLLAAVILVPCFFNSRQMKKLNGAGGFTDIAFFLYAGLLFLLSYRDTTFTDGLRQSVTVFMAMVPQYLVFSRWPKSVDDIKVLTAAAVVPIIALSLTAIPEFVLQWHFYASMQSAWLGVYVEPYALRGGYLRTYATILGPIAFGLMITAAITLSFPLLNSKAKKLFARGVTGVQAAALITTFSRGPWIGAVFSIAAYLFAGPKGFSRLIQGGLIGFVAFLLLLPTPIGGTVMSLLPFVGDSASETIDYRQRLLETGIQVMMDNPLFGSENYMESPRMQTLIQGQGIIDIVNSYLRIGLNSGFVGLGLFLSIHGSALLSLWRSMRRTRYVLPELSHLCRAYFASYASVMIIIATTSSVAPISSFYFFLAGLSVAIRRVTISELAKLDVAPAEVNSPVDENVVTNPGRNENLAPKKPVQGQSSRPIPKHLQQYLRDH